MGTALWPNPKPHIIYEFNIDSGKKCDEIIIDNGKRVQRCISPDIISPEFIRLLCKRKELDFDKVNSFVKEWYTVQEIYTKFGCDHYYHIFTCVIKTIYKEYIKFLKTLDYFMLAKNTQPHIEERLINKKGIKLALAVLNDKWDFLSRNTALVIIETIETMYKYDYTRELYRERRLADTGTY
jgi:hypothetical protein